MVSEEEAMCSPCPPGTLSTSGVSSLTGPPPTHIQAFSLNQNNALCLPVVSVDHKLVWVYSSSIAQEVAHAADALHGAFGAFPYPTPKEMVTLAGRCSLHVDQVRVWFMVQRLRYGISWDRADIHEVHKRLLGSGHHGVAAAVVGEDDQQAMREQQEEEADGAGEDVSEEVGERGRSEGSRVCAKVRARDTGTERAEESEGRGVGSGETGVRWEVGGEEQEQGREGRMETVETRSSRPHKRKRGEKKEKGITSKKGKAEKKVVHGTSAGDKGGCEEARKPLFNGKFPNRSENNASGDRGGGSRSTPPLQGPLKRDGELRWAEGGPAPLTNKKHVSESTSTPSPVKNAPFDLLTRVQVCESALGSGSPLATMSEDDDGVFAIIQSPVTGRPENDPLKTEERLETIDLKAINVEKSGAGGLGKRCSAAFRETPDALPAATLNESALGSDSALCDESALCNPALPASKVEASRWPNAKPKTKTRVQRDLMRQAFRACQYPNSSDYDRLSEQTGLDRRHLVQWFGDMRYHVKNKQPRWLLPGEQQRIMSRLRQRQRMMALATIEATADQGAVTWRVKLEGRGSR